MAEDDTPIPTLSDDDLTKLAPRDAPAQLAEVPTHIGPYHLLRPLGEGGMGEVWKAEQKEPIERTVALKLIKLGMDTKQFIARFESERQALALMEHPCIARVIDAGATETGRPYFVMEYVEGAPITEYCDEHRLTIRERLELFMQVCEGVQHAHQKGIIHRDLKPSNVMVTEVDGKPLPKIIDFGLAKATTQSLTDKTVRTVLGSWIGTPAYMSPEQAEITDDIDTRSDVYSLGVMLYELLTGLRPFDAEMLDSVGFDEMRRVIREVDAPQPSTRASASSDSTATAAEARQTEPRALVKSLKGDLDWIVMKAVEKEKERRYGSPADLAADIERHLTSQPVLASPPSRVYRAQKFVRRHRIGVAAGVAVTVSLVAAVAGTGLGFVRATAEAERANQEAETATQVSDFLARLFESNDPFGDQADSLTARELLSRGSERIDIDLESQPLVQARLMSIIGGVYQNLGLYEEAEAHLESALERRLDLLDTDDPKTLRSKVKLAWLWVETGEYERAESLYKTVIPSAEELARSDFVLETTPELADAVNEFGVLYNYRGDTDLAVPILERALAMTEAEYGPESIRTAVVSSNLALALERAGDIEGAIELGKHALALEEKVRGPEHPALLSLLNNLAEFYLRQKEFENAEVVIERGLRIAERSLGPSHPAVGFLEQKLGALLGNLEDWEGALRHFERSDGVFLESSAPNRGALASNARMEGIILGRMGDFDESEGLFTGDAAKIWAEQLGPRESLARIFTSWAGRLCEMGAIGQATKYFERSIDILSGRLELPPEHRHVKSLLEKYGECQRTLGREGDLDALKGRFTGTTD